MKNHKKRIEASITRVFKVVFPNTTNHYDTLFGGTAMYLMDEVAFITATRFSRKKMVTVSSSKIDFNESIPAVEVEIFKEEMYEDGRKKSIVGKFTFVAIDDQRKPISVL
jgi:acyl-CoA hydrolase